MQARHALPEWAQRRNLQQRPQANKNILPANEENDGLAYDSEGHVYVDSAVTDAATAVGPFDAAAAKRVGVCHFPTNARDPWQVHLQPHPRAGFTGSTPLRSPCRGPNSWARPWTCRMQPAQSCGLLQVHYITAPQPLAAGLVKYGDFLAPPKGAMRYGYGCLLYSQYCDFSTQGVRATCF